jgi:hypothetical protein
VRQPFPWQCSLMGIEHWWPRLEQASRNWLIENNGDVVSPDVVEAITQAGGRMHPMHGGFARATPRYPICSYRMKQSTG